MTARTDTHPTRRRLLQLAPALPTLWSGRARAATGWPRRALRLVVPFPPGGAVDVLCREIARQLSARLGQPVIVDNRPGAGGLIGERAVARAEPDGHTLAYIHSGLVTLQAMGHRIDLLRELQPLARLSSSPFLAVVGADAPWRNLSDLIDAGRAQPARLSVGSGGIGTPSHLAWAMLESQLPPFKALHVPFKGALEAAQAVVGGEVDATIGLIGSLAPLVYATRLRALAVSSARRQPMLPEVPTFAEAGAPDFALAAWGGLALPAGTPPAVSARLASILPAVLDSAETKVLAASLGSTPDYADESAFVAQIGREIGQQQRLVASLGLVPPR